MTNRWARSIETAEKAISTLPHTLGSQMQAAKTKDAKHEWVNTAEEGQDAPRP
eukprot:m.491701 g.491701  ORF g.491701 m.491701 type:complete len:53 (+) comp107770_c0_seq1:61-219(+)